jgi:hypothetical protein
MQHKRTMTIFLLGALAIATTIGAVAFRTVFAASPTTTSTSTTGITVPSTLKWFGGNGFNQGYNNQNLADALGITVDALNTAYQKAYTAALKQAVTDGLITQAQADELTTNGNAFPFGNRWEAWLTQKGLDFNTYLADALGISVDALKTAYQTAYDANIDQQVTNGNLTQTQADLMKGEYALYNDSTFQSSMHSAFSSAVNAAVSSGVITQAQADQILSNSTNLFMPGMGGMGEMGGPGGPHGHGGGFLPNNSTQPSTTP